MTGATSFSRTDLSRKTREILEVVRRGQPAVIQSHGQEQAVLLDPLDYRLLQSVAGLVVSQAETEPELVTLLRRYFRAEISLGKLAEILGLHRFELMERFERLGVPLQVGPRDLQEARKDLEASREAG